MTSHEAPTEAPTRFEIDFDHHSSEFRDNCPAMIASLHHGPTPLGHSSAHGGFWAVYGYDAIYDAVRNPDLFSSAHSLAVPKGVPPSASPDPLIPIDVDGPLVQEYRRVVLEWMSPAGANALEDRIREIATELIDDFIEDGRADLTQQLFTPLPARLILEMLGWDAERWPEWIAWIHCMIHDRGEFPDKAADAVASIYGHVAAEMEKRRTSPGDDLFGAIMSARFDGEPLSDTQIISYANLLLLGGMDTTAGLTGNAALYLDGDPELRRRLIDDPSLVTPATEEFLRHDSPAVGLYRTVTRDEVFHGQQLRKGEAAVLMFPAAGRDPLTFDRPDDVDIDRTSNRHMAFGLGAHRCLGSHHARIMFRVMLGELLRRLPDYRVDGEVIRFKDAGDVYAVRNLPVTFTPGTRSAGQ